MTNTHGVLNFIKGKFLDLIASYTSTGRWLFVYYGEQKKSFELHTKRRFFGRIGNYSWFHENGSFNVHYFSEHYRSILLSTQLAEVTVIMKHTDFLDLKIKKGLTCVMFNLNSSIKSFLLNLPLRGEIYCS